MLIVIEVKIQEHGKYSWISYLLVMCLGAAHFCDAVMKDIFGQISLRSVSTNCTKFSCRFVRESTEGGISSYLLCDILTALEIMVSIRQDFWFHDGYQAMLGKERQGIL